MQNDFSTFFSIFGLKHKIYMKKLVFVEKFKKTIVIVRVISLDCNEIRKEKGTEKRLQMR